MAKARNGEGSIKPRQVKSGTVYDVQLTVRDRRTGLPQRIFKGGFATERKAVTWRNDTMRKSEAGELARPTAVTVPELVAAWRASGALRAPTTERLYDSTYANHIVARLGIRASALTEKTLNEFLRGTGATLDSRGRGGAATNLTILKMLRAAYRWGCRQNVGLLEANPFDLMENVDRPVTRRRKAMPMDMVAQLLRATWGTTSGLLWLLLVSTGLRRGEALGLNWGDIDLIEGTATISKISSPETNGRGLAARTKGKAIRSVPLGDTVVRQLTARKLALQPGDSQPVIAGPHGQRLSFSGAADMWTRDCKAAGITGYTMHCLRHTWATTALAEGVAPNVVSSVLGHSSTAITLAVYAHETEEQRSSAVAAVGDVLGQSLSQLQDS